MIGTEIARQGTRIFDLWLACWTQEEIADAAPATDFDTPIHSIWKQQTRSNANAHPGNTNLY